ncbi:uncharacterized protein LOC134237063 [Saccostrea cucullata]|uniref:uncharacterized protein LOC134237063 n=1 Tax=Saccostrea cuccullata TaxID=36930 RepID=UPI002ED13933
MEALDRAQALLFCDLCQRTALQSHCELCQINLCKACVGEHLSDASKTHKVVPYKQKTSTPNYTKCPNHTKKHCELYCEKCGIPVCSTCISSNKHARHKLKDILERPYLLKKTLNMDLIELEKRIYPTYLEIASDLNSEKVNLETHYEKLATAVIKQGEYWHREINIIVNKRKSEIDEMKNKHLAALNKQDNKIEQIASNVKRSILDLKKLLETNEVPLASTYKSKNAEFRNFPPKVNVTLPSFSPQQINTVQLHQIFGSLSAFSILTDEHDYTMNTSEAVCSPSINLLLDEPELITTIDTGCDDLYSVTCLSNEEIWTCEDNKNMKLYNLQGKLLKSIQTGSGEIPIDIAVTKSLDLVFTNPNTRTVNIVKNDMIQEVLRLEGWIPYYVCSTSSGDLLVIMNSDDYEQSKVVRFSGSTEKQTIQLDSKGKSLYSSGYVKYINENRNLDICVADYGVCAVVVVNQSGNLRFRYTGHPSFTKGTFIPVGITTDSQSQILTADSNNHCIHILDQDGRFLRYIDKCDLKYPWGLCVDTSDNLFSHLIFYPNPVMDPLDRAQVLLLCDLCHKAALQSHCELCETNMCEACVGEHLSDSSKRHKVVPYKHRTSTTNVNYPKCPKHTQKHCELYCEKCDIPVCSTCLSSDEHHGHKLTDVLQNPSFIKEILNKDLKELEKRIYPTYEEIASDLKYEKLNLEKHYEKLTTAVTKQGEVWHREINIIVNKQKSEIDDTKTKHLAALNKQKKEINQITSEVKECILDLKKILDSNDFSVTSAAYKSRNAEFRSLPPKVNVTLPSFSPNPIITEQLKQMFGFLSAFSLTTEEHGYTMKTPEAVSCPPVKPLLDEPELITAINTGYEFLRSVTTFNDKKIWTSGDDKIMKLYNLQGKLLKSIQTKSGNRSHDIAVTRSGYLVYTDPDTRTVNILKNKQIQEVIRLQGWKPFFVCSTSSDDLLVTMHSDDFKQSKIVCYCGSTEKQTIQFDSEGKPLYSPGNLKYISENKNLDICVTDYRASAVVVVNQAGKLRFRYTGHPSTTKGSFDPCGITTDSQSQILTADSDNDCIHILDQDGQFLCFIDICDLPCGLCVDTRDNLFVAEYLSGKVKKIRYM